MDADDIADNALFDISQSGILTYKSSPDFETPIGGTANNSNTYQVVVQASDGGVGSFVNWFKVTVNVTDMEEDGMLAEWTVNADGEGAVQDPDKLLQFQPFAVLTAPVPTDSDGGLGTNGALTDVRYQWYRSSSRSATGTPIDGATTNIYTVSDSSTSNDVGFYLRVEATYSDRRGPNKTASYVSENPVQAARDDNTVPEFALAAQTRGIMENFKGGVGSPLTATDDDGDILTYSIAGDGDDNEDFTIDRATGQLMVDGLNFEGAVDSDTDNVYEVTVKATDSKGGDSDFVTVTITVTDVNESPTFSTGTEGMADDHQEDIENLVISTYTAADPEGAEVTLSLMGDDAALFELNDPDPAATPPNYSKVLAFKEMPDFEMPGDGNEDNVYEMTVRASDGGLTADRMVTVKVTDADEAGEVKLSSQDAMIGIELTAELTDSDSGAPDPAQFIDQVWSWYSLEMANTTITDNTEPISGADSSAYTPVVDDRGMYLRARVTYTDRTRDEDNVDTNNDATNNFVGFTNRVTSNVTTAVRNNPDNQRPVFAEGSSAVRLVEENTEALTGLADDDESADDTADNVGGGPVEATDADNDTVAYTLSGSDMFRVRGNGQIEVSDKAALDYEAKKTHTVTLTANDGTNEPNGTATITVTIHVTDLDEKPTISDVADSAAMGQQAVSYVENSTVPVIRLRATDPEGVRPIVWSLMDDAMDDQDLGIVTVPEVADDVDGEDIADRALFEISQSGVLTFENPPSFEGMSNSGDDAYQVVVQASDGGMGSHVNWFKVTVNVTNDPEPRRASRVGR